MWKFKFVLLVSTFLAGTVWAEEADDELDSVMLGDMMLTQDQHQLLFTNDSLRRHGLSRAISHWPKAHVPFKVDPRLDLELVTLAIKAMDYISNVSCVRFVGHDGSNHDHVYITSGNGCSSQVGNLKRGRQTLKLSNFCGLGNIIHELLHTLGFLHMHTAPHRDEFVKIITKNVVPSALRNFAKYTTYVSMFDTQYDYRSIMHYRKEAFAVDPEIPTIVPKEPVADMGQRREMSEGDITRLNRMYKCPQFREVFPFHSPSKMPRGNNPSETSQLKSTRIENDQASSSNISDQSSEKKESLRLIKMLGEIMTEVMNMVKPITDFLEKNWK